MRSYISGKHEKFSLSEIDLALVSNFKGGNASVVEPLRELPRKLSAYKSALLELDTLIGNLPLRDISTQKLHSIQTNALAFLQLTRKLLIPLDVAHHSGMISPTVPI